MCLDLTCLRLCRPVFLCAAICCQATTVGAGGYLGPLSVVASPSGRTLYLAFYDANEVGVYDTGKQALVGRIDLPGQPTSLELDGAGEMLYVCCAAPESTVCAIDTASLQIIKRFDAGHTASGLALDVDRQRLYVCNRFDNDVSVIELASGKEIARVPAIREPCAAVISPGSGVVFVVNHLPLDPANSFDVAAEVTVILPADASRGGFETKSIRLPNGSTSCRDIAISRDGKWAWVTHTLARYQLPATQLERGWMNTNALSLIDVRQQALLNTVLLDSVDAGAANPWGVDVSADGTLLCVTHAGSHELSVIDVDALTNVLRAANGMQVDAPIKDRDRVKAEDIPNDLALLHDKRRRIPLFSGGPYAELNLQAPEVSGPRGVAVVGSKAYVTCYYTDNLAIVDLEKKSGHPVRLVALESQAELDQTRIGEMLFNDARPCFQHWQSCASCHPDARVDALNWDLLNDGVGNGKNAKSMLLADRTPPMMISGIRRDAEQAVRAGIRHSLFTVRPEEDVKAIMAYLKSLEPVSSPHLVDGKINESAQRGRGLFFSEKVGCYKCHPEPLYTDLKMHDVHSKSDRDIRSEFDTPTLIESWRTAPYMHDGQYTTLKQVFQDGGHGKMGGDIESLSEQQLADLIEFVLSL